MRDARERQRLPALDPKGKAAPRDPAARAPRA